MLRLIFLGLLLAASGALKAEPPASHFAAAQLDMAQAELDSATAALQTHQYALARQLAAQARLDARLAWGMTESAFVRQAALELARRAAGLRTQGVLAAKSGAL